MPGPRLDPVDNDPQLPASVDVVVVGGGIIGASAALELAERGLRIALCEKGEIGAEQSSRNWGWVRLSHRDPREMPLMVESVRLWKGLNDRVGADTGYRQCGITFTCATDDDLADMEKWVGYQKEYQISARIVPKDEALATFPGVNLPIRGAMVNPADGRAEPQKAAPAIARAAQRLGATIHQGCAVRVVETAAGRICGVVTEAGKIACSAVLLSGGAWSRLFLDNMGIYLPQLRMKNTVLRTSPIEGGPEGTLKFRDFTLRRRLDGGYTIASVLSNKYEITPDSFRLMKAFLPAMRNEWSELHLSFGRQFFAELGTGRRWTAQDRSPFEETRILDPVPDAQTVDAILENLRKAYPIFGDVTVEQRWAGFMDVVPDAIPVISPTEGVENGVPGLFVATGFSGHGFGLGPAGGRLAADLVVGSPPLVDPKAFRLSRFSDGSKIAPISGVTRR